MTHKTLKDLEFDKILKIVSSYASSFYGRNKILNLFPKSDVVELTEVLKKIDQVKNFLISTPVFTFPNIENIDFLLERAKVRGSVLATNELLNIASALKTIEKIKKRLLQNAELLSLISKEAGFLDNFSSITNNVIKSINIDGSVKDNASNDLFVIRKQQKETRNTINRALERIIRNINNKNISDMLITIRDGRYVISIATDFKKAIKGTTIDYSKTGTTSYIEPSSISELNNKMRMLVMGEKKEVEKICRKLTGFITERHDDICNSLHIFANIDSVFARAYFSINYNCVSPALKKDGHSYIVGGHHPLLASDKKSNSNEIILQSLETSQSTYGIILTGPNAGGKTVFLKMVGLLHLMAQSGIPITSKEGTCLTVYNKIFTDIGDSQSIENSLSTFSAHIQQINKIINNSDENTLVLLDELGTGTDPKEGAALSMAMLDTLLYKKVRFVLTTHLNELKAYADKNEKVINACMEFNEANFLPTFKLHIGIPGKSYAFEIAQHIGLDENIIANARGYIDSHIESYEKSTADYSSMAFELAKKRALVDKELNELKEIKKEYADKKNKIEEQKYEFEKKILSEKTKYLELLRDEYLKEVKKVKESAFSSINHKFLGKINEEKLTVLKTKKDIADSTDFPDYKVGQTVRIKFNSSKGTIIGKLDDNQYQVATGNIKMTIHAFELAPIKKKDFSSKDKSMDTYEIDDTVPLQCDLRGLKSDEALTKLEQYIDSLVVANIGRALIVHGKGTGALRACVNEYLSTNKYVKKYEMAQQHEGGMGAVVINLN